MPDAMRTQHAIDLTGLDMSMTRRGNVYCLDARRVGMCKVQAKPGRGKSVC